MSVNYDRAYNDDIRAWLERNAARAAGLAKGALAHRACPVCGASGGPHFANNGHLDYERCAACSLVFMNPAIPAEQVDQGFAGDDELLMEYFGIVSKYRPHPPARVDPVTDNKLRDIYQVKRCGRLLDVGCSFGDFLHRAKFFYDVEGVEINPLTAAVAEQHFTVHTQALSALGFGKRYDIVTLHQVLYGIPDPVGLFKDIHQVLNDDGILYINTPNADSYAVRLYGGRVNHLWGYTTLNLFNESSLRRSAELSGFGVKSFRTEWLDIYATDVVEYYEHPDRFIHRRNSHIADYADKIRREDELHRSLNLELGSHGNYLVAVLEKSF
jgi:SAM-dependent methyltransferase